MEPWDLRLQEKDRQEIDRLRAALAAAVTGQTVADADGDEYVVVTRSGDRAVIFGRKVGDRRLHRIRVRDGLAQCIEVG